MVNDAIEQFRAAISAAGLTAPEHIEADGALHRFASNGKRGDDSGYYVLHGDGVPAGHFGCWRSGVSENWRANIGRKLSPVEAAAHSERIAAMQREREAERERRHAEAREEAARRWNAAKPADSAHSYLVRKGAKAHGIRQEGALLLVPMRDAAGELHSLQTIDSDGDKRFLPGGRVAGCYHAIRGEPADLLCIVEGYATGASVHDATGHAVAVAFNAGNLEAVARALREKRPDARIVVCADDDATTPGNPGLTKATEAARAVGGFLAVPDFGDERPAGASDFNDLAQHRGAEAVRRALERASAPDVPKPQPATPSAAAADPAGGDWPEPQPLTAGDEAKPYPIDALPAGIREAVEEVVAFVQCPPALAACCALSALSLAGQAMADVERPGAMRGPTSLYLLAIGESGERKTSCDNYFLRDVREWELEQAERMKPELARYAAELAAWEERKAGIRARIRQEAKDGENVKATTAELREVEADAPPLVRVPRLIHSDATSEALAWTLARGWPSGGVMSNEAGVVFGGHAMGRDSVMRSLSLLNALWDGGTHRVERRTSESFTVHGARLTMGLATQAETFRQFMEGTKGLARGNGFTARFLIAAPASTQGGRAFRDAPPARHLTAFTARLRAMLDDLPMPGDDGALALPALTMDEAARALWIRFHDDVEGELRPGGKMADVRGEASKAADNAARMAALFHLYAHGAEGQIGAPAVESAGRIVSWHLFQARGFLGEVAVPREVSIARRLDAWILDRCRIKGLAKLPRRDIQNEGPNPVRTRATLDAALAELADAGRIRETNEGRQKLVAVNPKLLGAGNGA